MKQIIAARQRYRAAQKALETAVNESMPIGAMIAYRQGTRLIEAEVIRATTHWTEEIWVRGKSGKEYKISHWRVENIRRT